VFTQGETLWVATAEGQMVLRIQPQAWGPNWSWSGLSGTWYRSQKGAEITIETPLSGTSARQRLTMRAHPLDSRRLEITATYSVSEDAVLTQAVLSVFSEAILAGEKGCEVHYADGTTEALPLPFGGPGQSRGPARSLVLKAADGETFGIEFAEPTPFTYHGAARLPLAAERLAAGDVRRLTFTLRLPAEAEFTLAAEDIPVESSEWFEWKGIGQPRTESVLRMDDWLPRPAGAQGRVQMRGDALVIGGQPVRFWGVNLCYAACAPDKAVADRRAEMYAAYGINAVRLHKFADGRGWAGILSPRSAIQYDPEGLARLDYFVARLKERGIYVKLSSNFGRVLVGPDDLPRVPGAEAFPTDRAGFHTLPHGALWYWDEVADLHAEQMAALLRHVNPHTGLSYAKDPAIFVVELVNENTIFFNGMSALNREQPALLERAGRLFFDWVKQRYGSRDALEAAWGAGVIGGFRHEKLTDEGWDRGILYPIGNPWFFDPTNLEGSQRARQARLLDTMQFMYERQNQVYERLARAIRATGYDGLLVASNWQAGRAYSHYLNLHSDARIGLVDRHNYFSGGASMLSVPGGGMLSTGLQQVAGRPFMLSEWIHTFPSEFGVEGPAILGAYGMGLNGWDVSFIFQNADPGQFENQLGRQQWMVAVPQILGIFPFVARQVLRGDVREDMPRFVRRVQVSALGQGRLDFEDRVTQQYDIKTFDSSATPAAALAVGRAVVEFTDAPATNPPARLDEFRQGEFLVSAGGQLRWRAGAGPRDGHFELRSEGTAAVVGFAQGRKAELGAVDIVSHTPYAAIYVTAREPDRTLRNAKGWLIGAIGRAHNTDMKYASGKLIERGKAPIRLEPVVFDLTIHRPGAKVRILDHDGVPTGESLQPDTAGRLTIDGRKTRTPYYLVEF